MTDRKLPPHMQRILEERRHRFDDAPGRDDSKRASLEQRRLAIQFDIDQGELAQSPDNPWSERIALLTEALELVERELAEARVVEPGAYHPFPATPLANVSVSEAEPYAVSFEIEGEPFVWQEKLDWIERGGLLAQPELEQVRGSVSNIDIGDLPDSMRVSAKSHLRESMSSLAVALRDARLNDEAIPNGLTLASLGQPCPKCGGWADYNGQCNACSIRAAREQHLFQERQHLMKERSAEAEERHRMAERLPLARRRMADVERELSAL